MHLSSSKSTLANRPSNSSANRHRLLNGLSVFLIGLCLLFYGYYVLSFSVNFPFQDDTSLLVVIYHLKKAQSFREVLYYFFRVENDHRYFLQRLISYVNYLLTDHPNFRGMILLANLNLLVLLGLLYRQFRQTQLPFFYFLPIPFLLFQPQYHEVSLWALTGLQHTFLIIFLFLILELLHGGTSGLKFSLAILLAALSVVTHGNGILVFAAGGFLLLVTRQYRRLAIWIPAMVVCLALYLSDYEPGGSGLHPQRYWANMPGLFVAKLGAILTAWPWVDISGSVVWGSLMALVMIPAILWTLYRSLRQPEQKETLNQHLLAAFSFVVLTIALVAVFRSTPTIVQETRFKIYAALGAVLFYLFLIHNLRGRVRMFVAGFYTIFTLAFYVSSYYLYTPEIAQKTSRYAADTYNWPRHHELLSNQTTSNWSWYFLIPAYNEGYWKLPDLFPGFDALLRSQLAKGTYQPAVFRIERIRSVPDGFDQMTVENEDLPFIRASLRDDIFLILHDESQHLTYLVGTKPKMAGRKAILTGGNFVLPGFYAIVTLDSMRPGRYRLGGLQKQADQEMQVIMTTTEVDLSGIKGSPALPALSGDSSEPTQAR